MDSEKRGTTSSKGLSFEIKEMKAQEIADADIFSKKPDLQGWRSQSRSTGLRFRKDTCGPATRYGY